MEVDIEYMSGGEIAALLKEKPELEDKFDWSLLVCRQWSELLSVCPEYVGWFMSPAALHNISSAEVCDLLVKHNLLNEVNWSAADVYDDDCNYFNGLINGLIDRAPEFMKHFDWSQIPKCIWPYSYGFEDKCKWEWIESEEFCASELANLLHLRPDFADKCDLSKFTSDNCEELDGYELAILLRFRPYFADKCDFSKFNSGNWVDLLRFKPEFADRCDFSKLDGATGHIC